MRLVRQWGVFVAVALLALVLVALSLTEQSPAVSTRSNEPRATWTYTSFFTNERGYRYQIRVVLRSPPAVQVALGDPRKVWLYNAPTYVTLTITNRTPGGRWAALTTQSGNFMVRAWHVIPEPLYVRRHALIPKFYNFVKATEGRTVSLLTDVYQFSPFGVSQIPPGGSVTVTVPSSSATSPSTTFKTVRRGLEVPERDRQAWIRLMSGRPAFVTLEVDFPALGTPHTGDENACNLPGTSIQVVAAFQRNGRPVGLQSGCSTIESYYELAIR